MKKYVGFIFLMLMGILFLVIYFSGRIVLIDKK